MPDSAWSLGFSSILSVVPALWFVIISAFFLLLLFVYDGHLIVITTENDRNISLYQVLIWWTGCSHMWRALRTGGMHASMPAICSSRATSDTRSTNSPSLNSATMSLATTMVVSILKIYVNRVSLIYCWQLGEVRRVEENMASRDRTEKCNTD